MSFGKAEKIFPKMPEQPAGPIAKKQPCACSSWYPSDKSQLMFIVPLLVIFLAAAVYCAYANWPGAEAFRLETQGFKWPWESSSGMKMPWQ